MPQAIMVSATTSRTASPKARSECCASTALRRASASPPQQAATGAGSYTSMDMVLVGESVDFGGHINVVANGADGIDADNWQALNESIDKPLLNRALRGTYPPGSTYKPFMALAALELGKRQAGQVINDTGVWTYGGHQFRSHGDALGAVDMHLSIVKSSNVYYYSLANELGVDLMHEQLSPLGFGRRTGIDLEGEVTGVLPSTEWKKRTYRKPEQQRWYAGETISLGIGQGYNTFTMLQLAHAMSTLVAGGQRHAPRVVREVLDVVSHERLPAQRPVLDPLSFKPEHVEVIRRAMYGVTQEGTSTRVFAGAPYTSGGKTGTAQAVSIRQNEKYNAAKLEEHQRDHSLYIAFAPADDPKIALALLVENGGHGGSTAAPGSSSPATDSAAMSMAGSDSGASTARMKSISLVHADGVRIVMDSGEKAVRFDGDAERADAVGHVHEAVATGGVAGRAATGGKTGGAAIGATCGAMGGRSNSAVSRISAAWRNAPRLCASLEAFNWRRILSRRSSTGSRWASSAVD